MSAGPVSATEQGAAPATATGRCLCGAVTFTAERPVRVSACHCAMCRRWSGGPYFVCEPENVTFAEGAPVGTYRSSDWAERGFCTRCGTALFYRLVETGAHYLNTFTIEDLGEPDFALQVFTDEKPGFYSFAEPTKCLTGPEIFAMFGAGEKDA
ncbi:GFA family protein [Limibaculum sp. M0105]|uniref:GFA family protein n=1 Tax=Thermohalobaculum xanthum TaxID=2753746 RepID=A0A8J7M8J3_9RHOB|nr:GFA family protein [Thermohalobaculum xanthum]MBK0400564.1 GFA family protein [Thermohalobaculum xanthum]